MIEPRCSITMDRRRQGTSARRSYRCAIHLSPRVRVPDSSLGVVGFIDHVDGLEMFGFRNVFRGLDRCGKLVKPLSNNNADNVNIMASSRILQATGLLERTPSARHRSRRSQDRLSWKKQRHPNCSKQASLPFDERLPPSCKRSAHWPSGVRLSTY